MIEADPQTELYFLTYVVIDLKPKCVYIKHILRKMAFDSKIDSDKKGFYSLCTIS